jgi:hypothetical protein
MRPVIERCFFSELSTAMAKYATLKAGGVMPTVFLLPECVVREDGRGAEVTLEPYQGKPITLTLAVTRILERQTLEVTIMGSSDRTAWQPVAVFPKKSYCGTYSLPLDLSCHPHVRHLRVEWKMNRWGQGAQKPVFAFFVSAEELRTRAAGAA